MSQAEKGIYRISKETSQAVEIPVDRPDLGVVWKLHTGTSGFLNIVVDSAGVVFQKRTLTFSSANRPDIVVDQKQFGVVAWPENDHTQSYPPVGEPVGQDKFEATLKEVLTHYNFFALKAGHQPRISRVETWPVNRPDGRVLVTESGESINLIGLDYTSGFVFEDRPAAVLRLSNETGLRDKLDDSHIFVDTLNEEPGRATLRSSTPEALTPLDRLKVSLSASEIFQHVLDWLPMYAFINPQVLRYPGPAEKIEDWIIENGRFPDFSKDSDYRAILSSALEGYFAEQKALGDKAQDRRTQGKYGEQIKAASLRLVVMEGEMRDDPDKKWDF